MKSDIARPHNSLKQRIKIILKGERNNEKI